MKLSVTIITFNEERNIERALRSAQFADEIVVVDSFSADRTLELCRAAGARVVQEKFLGYGQAKNTAASHAYGEWIFSLDADEEITPDLRASIQRAIHADSGPAVYQVDRLTSFRGRWIKHGGWSPDWLARLYRKGQAQFTTPEVHEELRPMDGGAPGKLQGQLLHHSFPHFSSQVRTNLKYAAQGARALQAKKGKPGLAAVLVRPAWKFAECYFLKLGLLDGKAGLLIALNAAYSQYMKYAMAHLGETGGKE